MLDNLIYLLHGKYSFMALCGAAAAYLAFLFLEPLPKQPPLAHLRLRLSIACWLPLALVPFFAGLGQWVFARGWQYPPAERFLSRGISFYPGLLGFLLVFVLASLALRLPLAFTLQRVAPCISLFHAFGRMGCWFGGCCYGLPLHTTILGVHIERVPTQLMEAFFCLLLFVLLQRRFAAGRRMAIYLTAYAVFRFGLEYLRGDTGRGKLLPFLPFTPAQQIAIFCLLGMAAHRLYRKKHPAPPLSPEWLA